MNKQQKQFLLSANPAGIDKGAAYFTSEYSLLRNLGTSLMELIGFYWIGFIWS
jgi:hypothetical protein